MNLFRYLIISLTLALCNTPEIYNYEIESDQDSEIIESKLQINTYIDDEKVEVNFQLFPKNIEKIQSYELLFDMKFRENYNSEFSKISNINENIKKKIIKLHKLITNIKKNKKKIIIVGNGGSAAIASHFSVDMTKNGGIRCVNFNESDLLTCFSNDYGYENLFIRWLETSVIEEEVKDSMVIGMSCSGNSKNVTRCLSWANSKGYETFMISGKKSKRLQNVVFSHF